MYVHVYVHVYVYIYTHIPTQYHLEKETIPQVPPLQPPDVSKRLAETPSQLAGHSYFSSSLAKIYTTAGQGQYPSAQVVVS